MKYKVHKPKTWDAAAEAHLTRLYIADVKTESFDRHGHFISTWVLELENGCFDEDDIEQVVDVMTNAGEIAIQTMIEKGMPYKHGEMVELLCRKQHDYGHQNINNFGILGLAIRMCDKFARIKNLQQRGAEGKNESLYDSYLDVVGYAAIAMMYHDGTFQLKLERDNNV
jgi:hypothetical protein